MDKNVSILVCCPTSTQINVQTVACIQSLGLPTIYVSDSLVYQAREIAVDTCIKNKYDYLLFIDSDIIFTIEDFNKLISNISKTNGIISGLYFGRKGNHEPVIYSKVSERKYDKYGNIIKNSYTQIENNINNELINIEGCGMGFCLIPCDILKKVISKYHVCFEPMNGLGEDLSFCKRVTNVNYNIVCDTKIKVGHIGEYIYTEKDWYNENK